MRDSQPCRRVLFGTLSGALALLGACGVAQASLPTRIAAAAGFPGFSLPDVPGASLSVIGAAQIDDSGNVIATCRLTGPGITYNANDLALISADRYAASRVLARTGSGATGVQSTVFSSTFYPRLGAGGSIALVGFLSGSSIDPTNNTGYWLGDRAGLSLSLRAGAAGVPGVPGASFYGFVGGFPCAVSRAGIAYNAQMQVGTGNVTIDNYQGLWAPSITGSGFDLVARAGVASGAVGGGGPPPSLAGETYLRFNAKSLVLADNGRCAFQATLAPSALTTDANDTVIVERRTNGSLSVAVREGDLVAALGATIKSLDTSAYDTFGGLSINSAGDLAFASIDPADPPTTGVSRLWRRTSTGALQLIAARNASSGAGAPSGLAGVFSTILAPALSSSGAVVFAGTVTLSAGGQVSGLWIVPTGAAPQLIAQSGVATGPLAPPGNTGVVFAVDPPLRGTYRINSRDQVAFRWKLEDGVGGATTANDDALWVWDPTQGILGVVRTGDSISIAGAAPAVRSINMFLGPAGNDDGRLMDLNSRGELACCVQFTDSTGALLVSQLPGIGACCRGATCSQSASSACSGPATRFAGIGVACSPVSAGGCCKADFDQSGTLNSYDLFDFLGAWFAQDPAADIDGSGQVTTVDVLQFLGAWYNGC